MVVYWVRRGGASMPTILFAGALEGWTVEAGAQNPRAAAVGDVNAQDGNSWDDRGKKQLWGMGIRMVNWQH